MVNSVLSSLPTFYMCTLKIYKGIIDQLDMYRRHCLWRESDLTKRNTPLAAWPLVCKPKDMGGLGVIDLQNQNDCLLRKHLDKVFNKADLPWVKLIWEKYYGSLLPPQKSQTAPFGGETTSSCSPNSTSS